MQIPKPKEIARIRKRAHMTIKEFAFEFNLSPTAVRYWEYGSKIPRPEIAQKILLVARYCDYIELLKTKGLWLTESQKMLQNIRSRGETFLSAMKIILTELAEKFEDLRTYDALVHTLDKELLTQQLKKEGKLKQDKNGKWIFDFNR